MRLILISLLALFAAACASTGPTLSAQQCDADWEAVGRADGADGAFDDKIAEYRAACARSGAALSGAEIAAWEDGWRDGIDAFCAAGGPRTERQRQADHAYCEGVAVAHAHPPRHRPSYRTPIYGPRIGVGIGVGSRRGVSGGVGVGYGVGIFNFGLGFGF